MKYVITFVLFILFFSGQILSQEKNRNEQDAFKLLYEKLNDLYNFSSKDVNEFNNNESFPIDFEDIKHLQLQENLGNRFDSQTASNDKNTRTTRSEKMLGEGFLQVESIAQSWDGANWVNISRGTNLYDAKNNVVQSTYQSWNVSAWENNYRYSYTYDVNDNQTEYTYQYWGGTAWVNSSRYLFTYNTNNDVTKQINQSWDGSAWVDNSQYLYTYDVNYNLTLQLYQSWSGTAWTDYSRRTYIYDSNNNPIEQVYQTWDGTAWANQYKYSNSYDSHKNLIQQISQNWVGAAWVNSGKVDITYNANDDPIEYIFQSWDVSVWKNNFKYSFSYNSNNDPIELLAQQWNVTVWENYSKSTLTYDANNNNTEQLSQTWNGTSWVNSYKYTYSYAPATTILLTSPNGGENWPVGTSRNITWTSSNISNVKLQYSTNSGTNWINIANVSANAGSYSWTIPNTTSANCIVLISDVSNALVDDSSDNVFTISTYPATINLNTTYSFVDPTKTSSYQIIGLPGANNLPITNIVTGSPGVNGDWRAFWDSGTLPLTEYSNSSTFNFTPGKAFWVISKNQISVNITNVSTVALAGDNTYSIPIHNGWNLISNPFDKSTSWSSIQAANGVTQPIHFYQNGSYSNPANFEYYKGYYFINSGNLTSLKIPYTTSTALPKQNAARGTELEISLSAEDLRKGSISVGVSEDAKDGIDQLDIFSPPSQFCEISMSLYNSDIEIDYKYLQEDFRPEIGEGQEFNFSVKNNSDKTLDMIVNGMEKFSGYEIFLLDKNLAKLYDLKNLNSFEVKTNTTKKEYSLLIGTEEFILQKKLEIMPTEFSLFQNYPNPFNPATKILFALPQQGNISLKIYNILGELAVELINNQVYDAGYHEVTFDGSKFASGIYLFKLEVNTAGRQPFVEVKKMTLIK